ncbi:chaoptin-like isoform X2 [Homalodisca vitripennis]|uniref:chaoptin-like isoform X2 n=1 Tax=Homalodisca vitripennis TaxID=197043 RepID=UPI001EE9C626|nr:chaoptin-like isoform X2 [Homalodisca vitripennis]
MRCLVMLVMWTHLSSSQQTQPCPFNSMCSCRTNNSTYIRDVSCVGVPFYKLPELPHSHISHLDVVGAGLDYVDGDSLGGQVETLRLITNNIIDIADKTFASMATSLRSLDLSQNQLDEIPLQAL